MSSVLCCFFYLSFLLVCLLIHTPADTCSHFVLFALFMRSLLCMQARKLHKQRLEEQKEHKAKQERKEKRHRIEAMGKEHVLRKVTLSEFQ